MEGGLNSEWIRAEWLVGDDLHFLHHLLGEGQEHLGISFYHAAFFIAEQEERGTLMIEGKFIITFEELWNFLGANVGIHFHGKSNFAIATFDFRHVKLVCMYTNNCNSQ